MTFNDAYPCAVPFPLSVAEEGKLEETFKAQEKFNALLLSGKWREPHGIEVD
jgi:hypothetical protein